MVCKVVVIVWYVLLRLGDNAVISDNLTCPASPALCPEPLIKWKMWELGLDAKIRASVICRRAVRSKRRLYCSSPSARVLLSPEVMDKVLGQHPSQQDNVLSAVRCGWFSGMQGLLDIDLSGNRISLIKPCAFHGAPKLRKIQLARNRLSFVASVWLEGLQQLQLIGLSHNNIIGLQDINVPKVRLANNPLRCSCTTSWLRGELGETRKIVDLNQVTCDHPPGLRGIAVANVSNGQDICPSPVVLLDPMYTITEMSTETSSDDNATEPSSMEVLVSLSTTGNNYNVTNTTGIGSPLYLSSIGNYHNVTEPSDTEVPVSLSTPGNNDNVTEPGSMDTSFTPSTTGYNNATKPTEINTSTSPSAVGDNNATESTGKGVQITLGVTTETTEDGKGQRTTMATPTILGSEGEDFNITCIVYWEQHPKITWTLPNGARLASEEGTADYPNVADKIQMAVDYKINKEGWPCHKISHRKRDCVNMFGKSIVLLMIKGARPGLSGQHSCTAETENGKGTAAISVKVPKVISPTRKGGAETHPSATETSTKPDTEFRTTESRAESTDISMAPPSEALMPSGLVSPLVIVVPTSVCFGAALMVICSIIGSKVSARLRH